MTYTSCVYYVLAQFVKVLEEKLLEFLPRIFSPYMQAAMVNLWYVES